MKKARISFFALLATMALTPSAWSIQSPNQIKMATLNFNAETNNQLLLGKRLDIIEDYILRNDLDAVLFQECWSFGDYNNFAVKVAEDLKMDVAYHFEDGVTGIRVTSISIVTKKALGMRNVRAFKLPHSALTFGDGLTSWVSLGETNILIGAAITLPSGQNADIWTAHLNASSSSKRLDQVQFALGKMKEAAAENGQSWNSSWIFFGGDLNSAPESPEMTFLRKHGFSDAWVMSQMDPGHTLVGDVNDPEYNPMVHGGGQFPSQTGFEETNRIDYLYAHVPGPLSANATRIFTAPINRVWMSDHYGVEGTFDFTGAPLPNLPPSDSDVSTAPPTTLMTLTEDVIQNLPSQKDFDVSSLKGFTVANQPNVNVQIFFTNSKKQIYPVSSEGLGAGDTVSFEFFSSGSYKYRMIVRDYRSSPDEFPDYSRDPVVSEMDGTVYVH